MRTVTTIVFLALVVSVVAGAADATAERRSISVIQTLLDTDYAPIKTLAGLSRDLLRETARREGTTVNAFVDPGRPIQTDAIDPNLGNAYHRLTFAGQSSESAFVVYETWGFAPRVDLLIFWIESDRVLFVGHRRLPKVPKTILEMKEIVKNMETQEEQSSGSTTGSPPADPTRARK